jgi:hypothetical protein
VQLLDLIGGTPDLAQHGLRAPHERLAHRGEEHATRTPLKQWCAQLAFELADAPRQRRLREPKVTGRRAQTAALGNSDDVAKLGKLHGR